MNTFHIFVIEDDDVDYMNVDRSLKKINMTNPITRARNGVEAWEMLESGQISTPVIIFLDLSMPKMDGHDFLKILREKEQYKSIPVIVMTVSTEESDKSGAFETGVQGYIVKPMRFDDFVEVMSAINAYWTISEIPNV